MKRAVLSCSGGMDSTGLLIHLLANSYEVEVMNFDYGQKHKVEMERLKQNLAYLKTKGINVGYNTVDISSVMSTFRSSLTSKDIETPEGHYSNDSMKSTVVPNRNAIFASIVYGYALSRSIVTGDDISICLGIHSGDHTIYPDCRPEFINKLYEVFSIGNWGSEKVNLYVPYLEGNKQSILEDTIKNCEQLGISFKKVMKNTNTCYKPDEKGRSCGKCGSCTERLEAFSNLGLIDPVTYVE